MNTPRITIVGDFNPANPSHTSTNDSIEHCAEALGLPFAFDWMGTETAEEPESKARLAQSRGIWVAPATQLDGRGSPPVDLEFRSGVCVERSRNAARLTR